MASIKPHSFWAYGSQWWKAVFAPAYDVFGLVGAIVGAVLWAWRKLWPDNFKWTAERIGFSPEAAMSDLVWFIPAALGLCVLIYRFIRAPYKLHVAQTNAANSREEQFRVDLNSQQRELDDQGRKIASLEQRLHDQTPSLSCTINQVIVGEVPGRIKRMVAFIVSVRNQGSDSVAEGWKMFLTLPGAPRQELEIAGALGPSSFQFEGRILHIDGTIYEKTAKPVPRGGMVRGYCFSAPLDPLREQIATVGALFEVECRDVMGRLVHGELAWSGSADQGPRLFPGLDQRFEPLIPPGSGVAFPAMPLFPIEPLSDEKRREILEKIASTPSPPIRVEINGFSFDPLPPEKTEAVQRAMPGVGELQSPFLFKAHILNKSIDRRVSLRFRSFEIVPGFQTMGVEIDGINLNLGPEEDTEGLVTVRLEKSMYSHLTRGNHLKILNIHDAVSELTAHVTVPTSEFKRFLRSRDEEKQQ